MTAFHPASETRLAFHPASEISFFSRHFDSSASELSASSRCNVLHGLGRSSGGHHILSSVFRYQTNAKIEFTIHQSVDGS